MSEPYTAIPTRAPSDTSADDTILPFQVEALQLRGRLVRFGPAIDTILARHRYPAPVAKLLGEAIVLTVLLGSTLKFEGRFILQTQSDGPVRMLVIDYATPGKVRACARFDATRVFALDAASPSEPGVSGGSRIGTKMIIDATRPVVGDFRFARARPPSLGALRLNDLLDTVPGGAES